MRKVMDKDIEIMKYRDVPVFLSSGSMPRFFATVGGTTHWGGSWDTLKKKLDAPSGIAFEAFDALRLTRDDVEQIRITAIDFEHDAWVVDKNGDSFGGTQIKFYHAIYSLTMRDKLEAWIAESDNWEKIENDINEARNTLRNELEAQRIPDPRRGK